MAQGWSSPSSSTESERSAIRAGFPAQARESSAWAACQLRSPAWWSRAALEQQQNPEHTEELPVRYAYTPASSLSFFFMPQSRHPGPLPARHTLNTSSRPGPQQKHIDVCPPLCFLLLFCVCVYLSSLLLSHTIAAEC